MDICNWIPSSEIVKKQQTFPQLKENFHDDLALHMQRLCLATESKYTKSSKVGHRAKACRSQSARQWPGEMNFSEIQHDNEFFLGELTELAAVQRGAGDS